MTTTSYPKQMQAIWQQYEQTNEGEELTIRDCFDWAIKNKLWSPRPQDVAKIFGNEMSDALRQEIRIDDSGRQYRAKHCVKEERGGIQLTFWGDIDKATKQFMAKSFQQRRKGIVNDSYQLKQDVDHFNEYRGKEVGQIQLILDFTDDVAELEAVRKPEEDAA